MKITQAHEINDHLEATVEFEDGWTTSVHLPNWASKDNIKDEAKRLRKQAEDKDKSKRLRHDLVD